MTIPQRLSGLAAQNLLFETIIAAFGDAVFLCDGETGAVLCANAKASDLYGYSADVFQCLTFADLSAGDKSIQREAQDRFARALDGEPQCFEWRARDVGGRLFWVEVTIRAALISDKKQLIVVVRDIEAQKKAARALRQSEERYRTVVNLSPDAIVVYHGGIMVMANRSALRLYGAEREEQLLGSPWTARVHPDFHDIVRRRMQMILDADELFVTPPLEQRHVRMNGSTVEVEVTESGIMLAEGRALLAVARDVTRRKRDEARFKTLLAQQEAILDNALVGIVLLKNRVIAQCNRRFEELFGYGEGEMLGCRSDLLYPTAEFYEAIGERAYNALAGGGAYVEELWLQRKDRSMFWGRLHGRALDVSHPLEGGSVWIFSDLTEQKQAREHLQLVASVFESTTEGITITDPDGVILTVNPAFTAITGYSAEEVIGAKPSLLKSGRHDAAFYRRMWRAIQREGQWRGEIWNRRKSGEIYPELLSISAVRDQDGCVTHHIGVFLDITELKSFEKQILFLAHHDPLTELPNRVLFDDRLKHSIHRAGRDNARLAVLFIDLDHFKDVNDTLGHPLGDQLLQRVARLFRRAIRAGDTLARLGGDEFTLLVENINDDLDAVMVAQKLLNVFARPFLLGEQEIHISASIGISLYPTDGREAHELIKNADAAMYRAKAKGRNRYACYVPEMTEYVVERLRLEVALRRSIENGELQVYFQPQVDLTSGALVGAEALVRWQHPELGMITPARFIPLAEETGFIVALGKWVLREACMKLQAWRAAGGAPPRLAINLSIKQLEHGDPIVWIERLLAETGVPPDCLEIEITESFIVKAEEGLGFLENLRAFGIHLSVDDFGTGYSSLMYLKRLPIQTLKIDRAFVMDIGRDTNNEAIVRTIIALARNLGLAVVAEGVETAAQVDFLVREGCRVGQGYYYSPPLPEPEFVARWLAPYPNGPSGRAVMD